MPFLIPRNTRFVVFAFAACLAVLVAACGGGDDAKPTTSTTANATAAGKTTATKKLVDNGAGVACPLVTTAQVSAATGTAMKDGVGQGGDKGAYDACEWNAVRGTPFVTLNFYKRDAQLYYDQGPDQGTTQVPGVGEKARWLPGLGRLEVLQGPYYFTVFVTIGLATPNEVTLAAAKSVAANVLQSLR